MKLSKIVNIDNWFSRSINIERDGSSLDAVTAYVPTSTTIKTLRSIAKGFTKEKHHRAWTLIGPYGSGKSSFAIFLNALVQDQSSELYQSALSKLKEEDAELANRYSLISKSGGAMTVLITGSFSSLEEEIFVAIKKCITRLNLNKSSIKQITDFINEIGKNVKPNDVIRLIKLVQDALSKLKSGPKGIILSIDEMGKFVEFAGKNNNDIYLLQSFAEL